MKVGIISDTHDSQGEVEKAIEVFNAKGIEFLLHAGDITSPWVVERFGNVKGAAFIGVFGNCDRELFMLEMAVGRIGGRIFAAPHKCEIGGKKVFMTHKPEAIAAIGDMSEYDIVVYGHTHQQSIEKAGKTLMLNSGKRGAIVVDFDDMSCEAFDLKHWKSEREGGSA